MTQLFERARKSIIEEAEANNKQHEQYCAVMASAMSLIDSVTDVDTANQTLAELSDMEHALTSKKELGQILNNKAKELGLKYDPKAKAYVVKDGGKQ